MDPLWIKSPPAPRHNKHIGVGLAGGRNGVITCWRCALLHLISTSSSALSLAPSPSFPLLCLTLSLCFSEWRELQRDQAGLAYWKQMADQRQEGHRFMKRGLNMPGPCRGACPWMSRLCVRTCVSMYTHKL